MDIDVLERFKPYKDLIRGHFEDIKAKIKEYNEDVENAKNTNRLLRIGIVGQVNAGKSLLLNALIFDGENVLPKAATPMTAALTVIKYAKKFKAEVQFYSKDDWEDVEGTYVSYKKHYEETKSLIEQEQKSGGLFGREKTVREISPLEILRRLSVSMECKASAELMNMVESRGLKVYDFLGKSQTIESTEGLKEFVGAEGRYTPIVRNVTLYYNYEILKDIEIIDTPGINDPIISRGRSTKAFLGKCDVVFMLSKCSHFMDKSDIQLLAQYLPEKGITDIVLVGSQFDGEFKGEREKAKDIGSLIGMLARNLNEYSKNTFEKLKDQCRTREEKEIMDRLLEALPPTFTSAMAYSIAKHLPNLDKNEEFYFDGYNNLYEGFKFTKELLFELSNISALSKKLEEQRCRKKEILNGRLDELVEGKNKGLRIKLDEILQETDTRISKLKTEDVDRLTKKEKEIVQRLTDGRSKVEYAFEMAIHKIQSDMAVLKTEIKGMSLNFSGLEVQSETYNESYDETVTKRFLWIIPYKTTETKYRTVTYRYAETYDAISKVEEFVYEVQKSVQQAIIKIINIGHLKARVREGVIELFDLNDSSFEPEDILYPVERIISKITIPDIDIEKGDFTSCITKHFSGRVSEDSLDKLREAQRNSIREVEKEVCGMVEEKTKEICNQLDGYCKSFVDNLTVDIQENLEQLRNQLNDRENIINQYTKLKETLKQTISEKI